MIEVEDWGRLGYAEGWRRQHELFDAMVASKKRGENLIGSI